MIFRELVTTELNIDEIIQTDDNGEYDNEWVVQIVGGQQQAKSIAKAVGYKYIGRVSNLLCMKIFSLI